MLSTLRQAMAIFKKNLKRNLNNKKKLLSQLIFPLVICAVYYLYKCKISHSLSAPGIIDIQPSRHNNKFPAHHLHRSH